MSDFFLTRREFVRTAAIAASGVSLRSLLAEENKVSPLNLPLGKAEHCIFIWLSGGAAQVDTFDPKKHGDGKKIAGSYYNSIPTAVAGVQVSEHLPQLAKLMDRCVLVRSLHHKAIDEHAAATNLMHTGRPVSGTIIYPSIGSIVSHCKGAIGDGVPPYVVMGYPNVTRGPGFLGAKHGYIYLTETESGPSGLKRPSYISDVRQQRREQLLEAQRGEFVNLHPSETPIADYAEASKAGLKLAGPKFMNVFDLKSEQASLRDKYGTEFGQRLLLARRLVESGVRFIEVSSNLNFINGTGWDTHEKGQLKQHELIRELDQGLSTLIVDLKSRKMLDKTLIVVATEFGRPAEFDSGGGRGHQGSAFSCVLAGGGLRTGRAIGTTDAQAKNIIDRPISVPDFFATIHSALGINPSLELYDGERPVPITDRGVAIKELFG